MAPTPSGLRQGSGPSSGISASSWVLPGRRAATALGGASLGHALQEAWQGSPGFAHDSPTRSSPAEGDGRVGDTPRVPAEFQPEPPVLAWLGAMPRTGRAGAGGGCRAGSGGCTERRGCGCWVVLRTRFVEAGDTTPKANARCYGSVLTWTGLFTPFLPFTKPAELYLLPRPKSRRHEKTKSAWKLQLELTLPVAPVGAVPSSPVPRCEQKARA